MSEDQVIDIQDIICSFVMDSHNNKESLHQGMQEENIVLLWL